MVSFKKASMNVHLWLGLASGLLVVFLGVTGCMLAFQREIEHVTQPYHFMEDRGEAKLSPSVLKAVADTRLPGRGAPVDFPANTTGAKYWANYSNKVDAALGSNKALMDAFLKGRAAISAKDMEGKDEAVATIRTEWERLVAAAAIHELNAAKTNIADQAKKSHYLSEAIGFIMGLQYKSNPKLSAAKYQEVMNAIGPSLYDTTADDINAAIHIISTAYNMDNIKGQL